MKISGEMRILDGDILDMITEEDFWKLTLDTLKFDENSHAEKITFKIQEALIILQDLEEKF